VKLPRRRPGLLSGLLAFACIVAGVAIIYWPAALIVAGLLLVIDRLS
jgi:hypothetical protein